MQETNKKRQQDADARTDAGQQPASSSPKRSRPSTEPCPSKKASPSSTGHHDSTNNAPSINKNKNTINSKTPHSHNNNHPSADADADETSSDGEDEDEDEDETSSDDDDTSSSSSENNNNNNEHEASNSGVPGSQPTSTSTETSIPYVGGRSKPRIHRVSQPSDIFSRVSAFLPKLRDANEDLQRQIAAGRERDVMVESVDDGDEDGDENENENEEGEGGKRYIEMVGSVILFPVGILLFQGIADSRFCFVSSSRTSD